MTGDLDEIRRHGELRVMLRPGALVAAERSGPEAEQRALLRRLAQRLGLRVRWIEASRNDALFPALREGLADLAVSRYSPAALRGEGLEPSAAIDWVDDVVVTGVDSPLEHVDDLYGSSAHVLKSAASWQLGGPKPFAARTLFHVPEESSLESILERVASGRYAVTVADSDLVQRSAVASKLRIIGSTVERRPVVWAMRSGSTQLRMAVDDFLFAEQVLDMERRTVACRDLEEVLEARVLRLVTRNSPTTCTVQRGGLGGFEYDDPSACASSCRSRRRAWILWIGSSRVMETWRPCMSR
jgi:membrane-bound lytic murein transglycosylase MltF